VSLAYFDTSALVKNYIREAGSSRVRGLLTSYEFLSSAMTPSNSIRPCDVGVDKVKLPN